MNLEQEDLEGYGNNDTKDKYEKFINIFQPINITWCMNV